MNQIKGIKAINHANLRMQPRSRWLKYADGFGLNNLAFTLKFKAGQSFLDLHFLCASPRPKIYCRGLRASSVTAVRFSCRGRRLLSVVLILLWLTLVDAPFPTGCRATEDLSGSGGLPWVKRRSTRWRRPSDASALRLTPTASATPSVTQGQWGCFSNTGSFSVFVWPLCFRLYVTFISIWSGTEKGL